MSIEEHAEKVWSYFNSIDKNMYGIKYPSMPILYFGDYNEYKKSPLKIITVGLNPSNKEFPTNDEFSRFYEAEKMYDQEFLTPGEIAIYLNSLNIYFDYNSNEWFENFEPILNAMNASYYTGYQNMALHTDLFTPLTTNESWSKYKENTNLNLLYELTKKGTEIWHRLADILQPDIVLSSLGESNSQQILNGHQLAWTRFGVFDKTAKGEIRKKPFEVHCVVARLPSGKKCLLVSGMISVIPFMITGEQKAVLGRKIHRLITGNKPVQYEVSTIEKSDPRALLSMLYESRNPPEVNKL